MAKIKHMGTVTGRMSVPVPNMISVPPGPHSPEFIRIRDALMKQVWEGAIDYTEAEARLEALAKDEKK